MKHLLYGVLFALLFNSTSLKVNAQYTVRVMSYNIHHCNPPSKPDIIDVDAVANAIKKQNPDIVALQEVDVNTGRSGRINEAAQLALKTGMKSFYFAKAIDHDGGDYGVAILSKYPLTETKTHHLPMDSTTGGEPRVLATASVKLPGGTSITIGSTHLDAQRSQTNRLLQIKAINDITKNEKQPIIIAGDFNATENTDVIKILDREFKRTCANCQPTIPVLKPTKAIDFIVYKPLNAIKVIKHEVVNETYASDHLPVIAVFEIR